MPFLLLLAGAGAAAWYLFGGSKPAPVSPPSALDHAIADEQTQRLNQNVNNAMAAAKAAADAAARGSR